MSFCKRLTVSEGEVYRLPTEAEWEYACRSGSNLAYSFGWDATHLDQHAWFADNTIKAGNDFIHEVGQQSCNRFGLHDMHGNVGEWCSDRYAENYYENSPLREPQGPDSGSQRVIRGGCFGLDADQVRSASRNKGDPDGAHVLFGFRVIRNSIG